MAKFAGMTTIEEQHMHRLVIDEEGDGKTSPGPKDGHVHAIIDYEILPAGKNNHVHRILHKLTKA